MTDHRALVVFDPDILMQRLHIRCSKEDGEDTPDGYEKVAVWMVRVREGARRAFAACLEAEGVQVAVWSGKSQRGAQVLMQHWGARQSDMLFVWGSEHCSRRRGARCVKCIETITELNGAFTADNTFIFGDAPGTFAHPDAPYAILVEEGELEARVADVLEGLRTRREMLSSMEAPDVSL